MSCRPWHLWRSVIVIAVLAAVLQGSVGTASAQYSGRNKIQYENFDWQVLNTPHFEIFFYSREEDLAARAAVLAEDAYLRLSRTFDHELETQVPFILYASPNDFQQTNISDGLIGEGTGGFSEPLRKRMVLPYPGNSEGFVHVINHELVHVFMFDIAFRSYRANSSRMRWFPVPLWFAEGMAEWFAGDYDNNADMWMRDATIYDWVVPLSRIHGGYQVYKEGQSAMRYIAATYGEEKVVEFFKSLDRISSIDRALEQAIGLNTEQFSEEWIRSLKREYWPLYSGKDEPDQFARRLTDHWEGQNYFFQQPAISPDGRYITFFSDFDGLVDLFVMDAIDGRILRKLVTGYRSDRFLSLHSFESSIGFSPDSQKIAFIAKSGSDEHLFLLRLRDGKILQDFGLSMDIARSPAWSPDGTTVVLSGTRGGKTDLYTVAVDGGEPVQITDDFVDEHSPCWFPDGQRILFSAHPAPTDEVRFVADSEGARRLQTIDFERRNTQTDATGFDLVALDPGTGVRETVVATAGADQDPALLDSKNLIFTSDLTGVSNLYHHDLETGETRRISDVLGGVFHVNVSPATDRLVFTAFTKAGFDIFLMENVSEVTAELDYPQERESTKVPRRELRIPGAEQSALSPDVGASESGPRFASVGETAIGPAFPRIGRRALASIAVTERMHALGLESGPEALATGEDPPDEPDERREEPDTVDLTAPGPDEPPVPTVPPGEQGGRTVGTVEKYSPRFSLDPMGSVGGGVYYTQGTGLGLANILSMSDLLGNHRMQLLVNFYGSLSDSDLAFSYYYLKRRINFAGGVFHYRNFLNSNTSSIGEIYEDRRLFRERDYGVFGLASYPFSAFERMDFELRAFVSDKTFYEQDPFSFGFFEVDRQKDLLVQPTLSWVHDSSFWGQSGPVTGSRLVASFAPAIPVSDSSVDRVTSFVDARKYFRLWGRNSLAFRFTGAVSNGGNPRNFVIGGPFTLRGWDVWDFRRDDVDGTPLHDNLVGNELFLATVEYRLPFVDALILGWPGRWGIGGISAVVFADAGAASADGIRFFDSDPQGLVQLRDLNADIGSGIRFGFAGLPIRMDWAWKTNLSRVERGVQFHFAIAPSF